MEWELGSGLAILRALAWNGGGDGSAASDDFEAVRLVGLARSVSLQRGRRAGLVGAQVGGFVVGKEVDIDDAVVLAAIAAAVLHCRWQFHRSSLGDLCTDSVGCLVVDNFRLRLATCRQGHEGRGGGKRKISVHNAPFFAIVRPQVNPLYGLFCGNNGEPGSTYPNIERKFREPGL